MSDTASWIAWAGIVIPLFGLAWSAISWVCIERAKIKQAEFENFYRIVLRIHNQDQSLISQTAAIFELRNYRRYKNFIVKFCENYQRFFTGPVSPIIEEEIRRTADFFRKA